MKFICLQENLKKGLNIVEKIVGKNLTLPILSNILLETDKNQLKISATDLEIGISYWCPGKIEKEGSITCPARLLTEFINNLPNEKVLFEGKNNILEIKCKNYKTKINSESSKDFPLIPKIKEEKFININQKILKNSLNQVVKITSLSDLKPEISGISLITKDKSLKLAATDRFRLAEKTIKELKDFKNINDLAIIIPARTILEVIRILEEKDEEFVSIAFEASQIMFKISNIKLVSRLIEGEFPSYSQIIPKDFKTELILDREEFINNIKIASLFSPKNNDIHLRIINKEGLEIISQDSQKGENKSLLKGDLKGEDLEISFNWRYIQDALSLINTPEIFLGLNDESTPGVLKPVGDQSYIHLIMPIKN